MCQCWAQTPELAPSPAQLLSPILDSQVQGSRALGQAGAVLSSMAGASETPYGGKNLPATEAPMVQRSSPSKISSDCLVLLWLPCPSVRDEPSDCDGTRRDSPAGEVPPLGMHQGPPVPPGPQGCACCSGQVQAVARAHSGPLTGSHYKVLTLNSGSCLALQGWRDAKRVGAKVLLTCCSKTYIHKCSF